MQKLFILKVGSALPALVSKRGDFEDWIRFGMNIDQDAHVVVDVPRGSPLPEYDLAAGVVITGSHAMVTEHQAWSERIAGWLPGAVASEIPVLGICYGHQLLAYALGGEVGDNPNGREYGTVEINFNDSVRGDALLGGLPTPIKAQTGHTQTVLRLPKAARRLANSERDRNQSFIVGNCAWGVQFHPEFDVEIMREYIHHNRQILRAEGQDPGELISQTEDSVYGSEILRRFAALLNPRKE